MAKHYIELVGERRSATTEFAEYWAKFNAASTHLIMVRDLFQHVIRRMLEPEAIGKVAHYDIKFYQNRFHGSHDGCELLVLKRWDPAPRDVRITKPEVLREVLARNPPPTWRYEQNHPVKRFYCVL